MLGLMEGNTTKKTFITVYTVEGHKTWRVHFSASVGGFDEQMLHDKVKVIETRHFVIDRATGELTSV